MNLKSRTSIFIPLIGLALIAPSCGGSSMESTQTTSVSTSSVPELQAVVAEPTSCPDYKDNTRAPYKYCDSGQNVVSIQEALVSLGYDINADGYYGPSTKSAVKSFQQAEGLQATGQADTITLRKLYENQNSLPPSTVKSRNTSSTCTSLRAIYDRASSTSDPYEFEAEMNDAVSILRNVGWGTTADFIVSQTLNGMRQSALGGIANYLRGYNCA